MSPVNFFLVLSAFLFSTVSPMQVSTDEMTASCDCPATGECGTCSGGLTKLTLQYIGTVAALVELEDAGGEVFSSTVNPGEVFMAVGTSGPGKFQGSNIEILIDGVHHEDIPVTCHSSVVPHATFGDFRIVAGESQNGGPLCCPPGSEEDNILPTISNCPTNIEVDADASGCSKSVTWTAPSASDNCTLQSFTPSHAPGSTFPVGITTVTYTATDDSDNTATCQFDVIVKDVTAPTINQCPANIEVDADASGCSKSVTWTAPNASDNCTLQSFTPSHAPGSTFPVGITTVTYTATDDSDNTATCQFDVIVKDVTAPTINQCSANIEVDADDSGCSKSVSWTEPTASDNCTLQSFTSSHAPGSTFPAGTTTVTYTATDASGNTATCQFDVVVKDIIAPVISQCPENITVTADGSGNAVATWSVPTFSDNCAGAVLGASHNPGDVFTTGVTTVTYSASDLSGNSSLCTFTVTVQASVPPDEPDPTDPDPDPTDPDNEPDPTDPVLTEPGATEPVTEPNPTQPGTTEPDSQFLLEISKIVTPDGNGINDFWMLLNIEQYRNNEVLVVDRWGNEIFRATGYDNENVVWSGRSDEGKVLPAGTYFYVIRIQAESATVERKGFVELVN